LLSIIDRDVVAEELKENEIEEVITTIASDIK